jgi:uncharacterized protein with PIN domain
MNCSELRFYAELNDFLPPERRFASFACRFQVSGSVKDLIEAAGVPHTEVDLILANGESVDFSYLVRDGDRIAVYPVFESIDITPALRVRPRPLRQVRFVLDAHLGRLASYLRMLGFDALYRNDYRDEELVELSGRESRILLTRDRNLLKHRVIQYGYAVRETNPRRQAREVLERFDVFGSVAPFTRCLRCNDLLAEALKEAISDRLPPSTREHYEEFRLCRGCGRLYWAGSHYRRMERLIGELLGRG